jgi:hypothetical protein
MQPSAEKAAAYSRHVYEILAGTGAEVTKVAEAQFAESQKKILALVDNAVKNAPAGSENAVALVKSAVAAANNAFESVQKAAKQATEVAEANFQAMTATAVKAAQSAPKAALNFQLLTRSTSSTRRELCAPRVEACLLAPHPLSGA